MRWKCLKTRCVPAARCGSAPLLQAAVKQLQRSNTRDLHARDTRRSLSARISSDCEGEDYCPRDCLILTSFLFLFPLMCVWMCTWGVYVREWSDWSGFCGVFIRVCVVWSWVSWWSVMAASAMCVRETPDRETHWNTTTVHAGFLPQHACVILLTRVPSAFQSHSSFAICCKVR